MTSEKKQYVITIGGISYALLSDEAEDHIMRAAQRVDELMRVDQSTCLGDERKKRTVLIALKLASDLIHLEQKKEESEYRMQLLSQDIDRCVL